MGPMETDLTSTIVHQEPQVRSLGVQFPVPKEQTKLVLMRTDSIDFDEQQLLRQPCDFGKNLCRTESIDKLFDYEDPLFDLFVDLDNSTDTIEALTRQLSKSDSKLSLVRDNSSWGDFFNKLV